MPHTVRWQPSDWAFALDAVELLVRCNREDSSVAAWGELRQREQVMGCTLASRMSLRLGYIESQPDTEDASVSTLDDYRNL
jgi:hypothetical protein